MDPYTLFGYDENMDPVVAPRVTAPEARKIARDSCLTGYFLAPHWSKAPNNGGMRAYRWDSEEGDYQPWAVRPWLFTHVLDPKVSGMGLDDKPVEAPPRT